MGCSPGNIVAARFDHIAARPAKGANAKGADDGLGPDPHLHPHAVIANMTRRPDGAWRGLDPVEIYRSQSFAGAVHRSELAREVRSLGYGIRVTGADGRWELEVYSREWRSRAADRTSSRRSRKPDSAERPQRRTSRTRADSQRSRTTRVSFVRSSARARKSTESASSAIPAPRPFGFPLGKY
jgi:conjugative relaxase-like TrwC/TraI family protein